MASLLFAGGVLAYEKIKDAKAKKAFRKAHNESRYSDLQSSTCTCGSSSIEKDGEERDVKGCPVHDPALRKRGLKEEERRGREELVRGDGKGKGDVKEEKRPYTGDEEGDGEQPLVDTSAPGTVVGEESDPPPPKYEDVAAARPVGFKDRIRRKGKGEEEIVR